MTTKIIGLIPAAGRAERFHGMPKWALPVYRKSTMGRELALRMEIANPRHVIVGTRPEMYELARDAFVGVTIAQTGKERIMVEDTPTMTATILSMQRYCPDDHIAIFGMPDTWWSPEITTDDDRDQVYARLVSALETTGADAALAMWRIAPKDYVNWGMVDFDAPRQGERYSRVRRLWDKWPEGLQWGWGALAWRPSAWAYFKPEHPHVGYGISAMAVDGKHVVAIPCEGQIWNCNTGAHYWNMARYWLEADPCADT